MEKRCHKPFLEFDPRRLISRHQATEQPVTPATEKRHTHIQHQTTQQPVSLATEKRHTHVFSFALVFAELLVALINIGLKSEGVRRDMVHP